MNWRLDGPWSDGIHVNSSGFDPSPVHEYSGRKRFANLVVGIYLCAV
jgi:xylan 1,4-beta-xylosidase